MAEFLVNIDWSGLYKLPDEVRDKTASAEREIGIRLIEEGTIQNIWEIPGEKRNVGIWSAQDANALLDVLSGLPIYPHVTLTVQQLATHPLITDNYNFLIGRSVTSNSV